MNNGRIWCVVNPTVGLPLFLGSVALMSFTVHFAVLNNTTWVKNFFNGGAGKVASADSTAAPVASLTKNASPGFAINIAPLAASSANDASGFIVTLTPKTATGDTASIDRPAGGIALASRDAK
jgi:light-harvesting protein B-800-850 alpha chain